MHAHKFDHIVVPVDFSDISAHALRTASLLREHCGGGEITALYANWFQAPPYFTSGRLDELRKEFRESLQLAEESLGAFVRSALGSIPAGVTLRVVEALPADGVRQTASLQNADLIVMGTHGRSGLNRWMLGSVAERVLRESSAPVLTVRSSPPETMQRMLCPVDDTRESRRALSLATSVAACFGARLTVLHVTEPAGDKPVSDLCSWIPAEDRARCSISELALHGDAAEQIVKLAASELYDLIVMGSPRRKFFEGMVLGTTTLRTVRHAPCPVLTVGPGPE